jgi:ABC-type antimicrobial peptide transport system permease subunit
MNFREPRVLIMRRSRIRLTIGTMMVGIAVSGILSWLITGLVRYGAGLFRFSPLYLVVTFPFLFSFSITFVVTLLQLRRDRRRRE